MGLEAKKGHELLLQPHATYVYVYVYVYVCSGVFRGGAKG